MNFLFLFLSISAFAAETPKPKYGSSARLLRDSHDYTLKHKAPDYWALSSNYVPQITGSSCTAASVVMALNALRNPSRLSAADMLITQKNIHDVVKNEAWQKAVAEKGGGYGLDDLAKVIREALTKYGFKEAQVEAVHIDDQSAKTKKQVHAALIENEKNEHDIMISNFQQSDFTGDPEGAIGHVSPVGAYDAAKKQVLIMDADRDWYEPYWVSEDTFIKGMNTKDSDGKANRGYIVIKAKI